METPATVQVEEICRASGVAGWWVIPSLLVAQGPAPWEGQSFLSLNPSTSLTRKLRKPASATLFASCLPQGHRKKTIWCGHFRFPGRRSATS